MPKHIFDRIHGDVVLPDVVASFLHDPRLLRLSHVKQLGGCSFVYPSATHTRLEHSIGVCHLARLVCSHLEIPTRETELIQLAGLLHDVGHGPFSHTYESATGHDHESAAVELCNSFALASEGGITAQEWAFVSQCIRGVGETYQTQIVHARTTGIDVDKLDYLMRDAHSVFGITKALHVDRIIGAMRIHNGQLAFDGKVASDIVDLFALRARLHRQVYQHPSVLLVEDVLQQLCLRCGATSTCTDDSLLSSPTGDSEVLRLRALLRARRSKYVRLPLVVCTDHDLPAIDGVICATSRVRFGHWSERLQRYDPLANVCFVDRNGKRLNIDSRAFFVPHTTKLDLHYFYRGPEEEEGISCDRVLVALKEALGSDFEQLVVLRDSATFFDSTEE